MLESKPFSELVVARLGEFFAEKSSWFRGLWDIGTVPALRELLELVEVTPAVVSQEALDWYVDDVESTLSKDGGVPRARLLEVRILLKNKLPPGAPDLLHRLTWVIDDGYLDRWATAIDDRKDASNAISVERTARATATHRVLHHGGLAAPPWALERRSG